MKRVIGLAGFGLGYVLGARAGRERYEQIMRGFRKVREDPRVQEQAQHLVDAAKEQAPVIKDKVSDVASTAVNAVRPHSDSEPDDARQPSTPFTRGDDTNSPEDEALPGPPFPPDPLTEPR